MQVGEGLGEPLLFRAREPSQCQPDPPGVDSRAAGVGAWVGAAPWMLSCLDPRSPWSDIGLALCFRSLTAGGGSAPSC